MSTQRSGIDRRSSSWKRTARGASDPKPNEAADHEGEIEVVEGIEGTYVPEPRCHVCQLPEEIRTLIDSLLATKAWGYNQVLDHVEPLLGGLPQRNRLTYDGLRRHCLRHVGADRVAVREIVERRAAELGRDLLAGRHPLLTSAAIYELVRAKGFEAIAEGRIEPTVKEALEAARLLEPLEQEVEVERDREVLMAFIAEVRDALPEDGWEAIATGVARRLGLNPAELPALTEEGEGDDK